MRLSTTNDRVLFELSEFEMSGETVTVYVGNTKAIETSENVYAMGSIGFKTYRLNLSIRSVKVTCL
jgi:hypothetical protein